MSIPEPQRRSIPWILWMIWKNRNMILYADTQESLSHQLQQAIEEARLWHEVNTNSSDTDIDQGLLGAKKKWEPPLAGSVKCSVHSNWRNAVLHSGVAYIVRDYQGNVLHHSRDAITSSPNRLTAELRCLIWTLRSMKDLGYQNLVVGSDSKEAIEAVRTPKDWPRYRSDLTEITHLLTLFRSVTFETESMVSNQIAREIARSVLRDGRFNSYLALGGPPWLHQRILREATAFCS